jgi:hypothetical protein
MTNETLFGLPTGRRPAQHTFDGTRYYRNASRRDGKPPSESTTEKLPPTEAHQTRDLHPRQLFLVNDQPEHASEDGKEKKTAVVAALREKRHQLATNTNAPEREMTETRAGRLYIDMVIRMFAAGGAIKESCVERMPPSVGCTSFRRGQIILRSLALLRAGGTVLKIEFARQLLIDLGAGIRERAQHPNRSFRRSQSGSRTWHGGRLSRRSGAAAMLHGVWPRPALTARSGWPRLRRRVLLAWQ